LKERPIEIAIRKILSGRTGRGAGKCPDENFLAAYLEESLSADERTVVEQHASDCLQCQQVLAHAIKLQERERPATEITRTGGSRAGLFAWLLRPLPALASILIALTAGTILYRFYTETPVSPEAVRISELRRGVPEQEPTDRADLMRTKKEASPVELTDASSRRLSPLEPPRAKPDVVVEAPSAGPERAQEMAAAPDREEVHKPAAGESPKKSGAGAAGEPEAEPTAAVLAEVRDRPGTMRVGGIKKADLRTQFRRNVAMAISGAPNEAIAAVQSDLESAGLEVMLRQVGSRKFYRTEGYWVDERCLQHLEDAAIEIDPESEIMKQILVALPEMEELRKTEIPILLYWDNKNCVIR